MMNSEKKYENFFNFFIYIISITLIFRKISTFFIILFVIFNVVFFKKLNHDKKSIYLVLIILSPLLLDILFFWNNDNLYLGLKSSEKRLTLLFFPLFIIGFRKQINFNKLIKFYTISMTTIMVVLFIRYTILNNKNFVQYLNGKYLWQMGYDFSNSFDMHAPALNMHISFVTISLLYLLLKKNRVWYKNAFYGFLFLLTFTMVLYINTRIAIINSFLCTLIIILLITINKKENIKLLIKKLFLYNLAMFLCFTIFVSIYPHLIHKISKESFLNIDMVGRLDEIENPETTIHGSLVTRLSIWKSSLELAKDNLWVGFGASDSKRELVNYYNQTNQKYLEKFKFPVHNQYLDFLLKFGILGFIVVLSYVFFIGYLGVKINNALMISFFVIFFTSNLTDDFLIRYDGITFSGFWISIFANQYKFKLRSEED